MIVHVFICFFLILLVLIQNDKGGGLAGALGGMSGAAFTGASVSTIVTKITQGTAIVSFIVILILNALSVRKSGTVEVQSELKSSNLSSVIPEGFSREAGAGGFSQEGIPGLQRAPEGNENAATKADSN